MKTSMLLLSAALSLSTFAFVAHADDSKMPEAGRMVRPRNQPVESVAPYVADRFDDSRSQSLSHIPDDVNCAGYLGEDDASGYDAL